MEINALLKPYIPLVEYLGKVFGENCEVILHDLTNIEHSIVAIANGHITSREVGGHITDFGLEVVHDPRYQDKAYAVNYPGSTPDRSRMFKSSTYFIRDEAGITIGLLCMNVDITDFLKTKQLIDQVTSFDTIPQQSAQDGAITQETFASSVEETMAHSIDRIMAGFTVPPQRLTIDEKKSIVEKLHSRGVFALKGSVNTVAKRLDVSEPTIYRYLRDIQSDK